MNEVHVGCHCLSIVKHIKQKNRPWKKKKTRKSHFTVTFPTLKQKQIHIKNKKESTQAVLEDLEKMEDIYYILEVK